MILVGQYDSPFVRRVAITLHMQGIAFERDTRSVFGDFDALLAINPLGRIPALVLGGGEVLIDSAAILDHLDEITEPARRLMPRDGAARRDALRRLALAAGTIEKAGATIYGTLIRPAPLRWPDWIARCRTQAEGGLAALDALDWPPMAPAPPAIATACLMGWLRLADPSYLPAGRYPALEALAAHWEAHPAFVETRHHGAYGVPRA